MTSFEMELCLLCNLNACCLHTTQKLQALLIVFLFFCSWRLPYTHHLFFLVHGVSQETIGKSFSSHLCAWCLLTTQKQQAKQENENEHVIKHVDINASDILNLTYNVLPHPSFLCRRMGGVFLENLRLQYLH